MKREVHMTSLGERALIAFARGLLFTGLLLFAVMWLRSTP